MSTKILSREALIKDVHLVRTICLFGIFGIVGLFGPVYGLYLVITNPCTNSLLTLAFLSVFPGFAFGYFIFWRNARNVIRQVNCLKTGKFVIVYDEVVDKDIRYISDDTRYMLELKKFSEASGKMLTVTLSEYKKLKKGTQCILVLEDSEKYPTFYNANEYVLHNELRSNVVGIFDANRFKKRGMKG